MPAPGRHYLLLVFAEGKEGVRREYVELSEPEESIESALTRWVESHPDMIDRQRNREKVAAALRESPLYVQLCHPSSWWRELRERGEIVHSARQVRRRGE